MDTADAGITRAERPAGGRVIAGVCAGISEHLGIPILWVRAAFALGVLLNGLSIVAYAILWRFMPLRVSERSGAGIANPVTHREVAQAVAIGAVVLGVLGLLMAFGPVDLSWAIIPAAFLVLGVAVVWRLVDDATMNSWIRQTSGIGFWVRLLIGVLLVIIGLVVFLGDGRSLGAFIDFGAALVLALLGVALLLGPWAMSLWKDLQEERRARVRSQERAEVAAHLHDSVLQTLALLQKNAKDPATVATMARRQERELRAWLYGEDAGADVSFAALLRDAAADIEEAHQIPVEVVTVGDVALSVSLRALAAAARESMVNAAKHSRTEKIDVFAEVHGSDVEVFVRDRGHGFDMTTIDEDRLGVRHSIIQRTERHGGRAEVLSTPGEGTEVRLSMTIDHQEDQ